MVKLRLSLAILALFLASLACEFARVALNPEPTDTISPTLTPTSLPTETSSPTSTPTLTATPNRAGTAEALATLNAEQALATIIPELNELGYTRNLGQVVWQQDEELELMATGGGQLLYEPLEPGLVVKDFMLGFDVTWNSSSGIAACGILFRGSDEDMTEAGAFEYYRLSGFRYWQMILFRDGYFPAWMGGYVSSAIDQDPNSTNHFVIVGRGLTVTAFANGHRLGAGTLTEQRVKGEFGVYVAQDTGTTLCSFTNGWILDSSPDE
ncbi:MAG: hypothetical protein WEA61_01935 [Anaerolineales bacterium]